MNILVIDIGGSRVKLFAGDVENRQTLVSGPHLRPDDVVQQVLRLTEGWSYDAVSIGYPGSAGPDGPSGEAGNLGDGWVGFDFESALGRPVRVANDAAMQALGSYEGGRMLFLGLGTGLGSTLIAERVILPLELGCLEHRSGQTLAQRLGKRGLANLGKEEWMHTLHEAVAMLHKAFATDYVVIGGGNAENVDPLPVNARKGGNDAAFTGGVRLWDETLEAHDVPASHVWRVVW